MIKKHLNRGLAALLSLGILFIGFGIPVCANESQNAAEILFQAANQAEEQLRSANQEERVKIIVELEDKPLLAYQTEMRTYSSAAEFLESDTAKDVEKTLASNRKQFQKYIMRSDMDVTVDREYSAVMNGFSLEAQIGDLEAIKHMEGVKNAFVAELHKLIQPATNTVYTTGSVPAIGGDIVGKELGYTGKSSVVAIIDTGLDTEHDAFANVNNPKYSRDDIADLIKNNKLTIGKLNVSAVYVNEKIPYAYDYADVDTNVSGGQSHGTHVAGIIGANSGGVVQGVAPDAQFFIMKVFGDNSGGAYDDDILAALDDAVKLGADSINMSLGSTAGFSEDAVKTIRQVYERVDAAGIGLYCAAGNEYSSTYHNSVGNDLPKATEPDNGTVGSPSTYAAALSVASMNNVETTSVYFIAGDRKVRYNDSAENKSSQLISLSGNYTYVDCGVGSSADFAGQNVKGKIALIRRAGEENGEVLTFVQKENNAKSAGALAAIIYDNVDGELVSMATDNKIPCVFISKSDGEYMRNLTEKDISVSEDYIDRFKDHYSGRMSDFSSWGVTPDLKLKPEITAPGGDIYSTLPGGLYGNMSGTSMASPHLAGAAAVMDQYIREERDGLNMTSGEKKELANALMLSTAVPIRDERNNFYSPRKQGAGIVQLSKAATSGAYLLSDTYGRPKAELGDNPDGSFAFSFMAKSLTDVPITYETQVTVLTEDTVVEDGISYMAQYARVLSQDEVTVNIPQAVTLDAKGESSINVTISLTEEGKKNLKDEFPNGIYVEGYVTLTPVDDGEAILSYPFMGFYGDWSELPIFDSTIYDDQKASLYEMQLGQFRNSDGGGYILGYNRFVDGATEYNAEKIAIQGGDSTKHITAVTSLLRSVDKLTFSAQDSDENTVYTETLKQVSKTYYMDEAFYTPMADKGWTPYDTWNSPLDDGNYLYTVTAETCGSKQSVSFPVVIDSVAPEVISSTIEGANWKIKVRDNHYIQAVCVTATGDTPLTEWVEPDAKETGATSEVVFQLSDDAFKGLKQARIAMIDYAGNQYISGYYSLEGEQSIYPESIVVDKANLIMNVGDTTTLTATVLPENASDRTVTWSSSDKTVATVSERGIVTALKKGSAEITAETGNGLKAVCVITVNEKISADELLIASVSAFGIVKPGGILPFDLQLENMKRVATVSFTFEKDSELIYLDMLGKNGFTPLGIKWNNDHTGTVVLSYLQEGAGGSVTKTALTDIARLEFETMKTEGSFGLKLTKVDVSGYDENGKAVFLTTEIGSNKAQVTVSDKRSYDLNKDGVVDLLDITYCQKYYRQTDDAANWNEEIKNCDLDCNGVIDVQDMVVLLQVM